MKKFNSGGVPLLSLSLFCSVIAFGQSVTISPNNNVIDVKATGLAFGRLATSGSDGSLNFYNFNTNPIGYIDAGYSNDLNIGAYNTSNLQFWAGTGLVPKITLTPNGKVGFGSLSPNYNLQINDATNAFSNIQITNTGTGTANANGLVLGIGSADAYLKNFQNGKLTLGTNNSDKLTILANGNVGVGTSSPNAAFQVHNTSSISNIQLTNNTTGSGSTDGFQATAFGNDTYLLNQENGKLVLGTNGANNVTITPAGYIQLGDDANTPKIKMKKITGTMTPYDNLGLYVRFVHGLTQSKILSVSVLVTQPLGQDVPPTTDVSSFSNYIMAIDSTYINFILNQGLQSSTVINRPVRILITYEE